MMDSLRGGLVVSCQAYDGEPLRDSVAMLKMAQSAVLGGAAGIRANGLEDIGLMREILRVPLIGILKSGNAAVFITPTLSQVVAVANAGADIVAIDGTRRSRPDGLTLSETIRRFRDQSDALILADVGSIDDGLAAADSGADMVATTLVGYTGEVQRTDGPDLDVLHELASRLAIPVLAEGRIRSPTDAVSALTAGAFAVVVGTAVTHPTTITSRFAEALAELSTHYPGSFIE